MNANLKAGLVVIIALIAFKVMDRLFLDKAVAKFVPSNYEEESFED